MSAVLRTLVQVEVVHRSLDAALEIKLVQNIVHVIFCCIVADSKRISDVLVQ